MRNRSPKTITLAIVLLASSYTALFATNMMISKDETKEIAKEAYILVFSVYK